MNYAKWNNLLGWCCGLIATAVYIFTTDRYNSWWDTGEFIASAYKLQVVHQPGAPLFLMIQNLFSNLAFGNTANIAFWMNVGSAVCSGLTIVFLFWTITMLARKLLVKTWGKQASPLLILCSGIVGALAYAFSDTFWYSAVESEVYAMSSLCTAVVFWMILKWEARADHPDANRWLLAIAFVMGLSIGVHLLNLLTIPALVLLIYFKKAAKITLKGSVKTIGIGIAVLAFVLWGIIQYSVRAAAYTDLFFVNTLGLGFGAGISFFVLSLATLLVWGLYYTFQKNKPHFHLAILAVCFVFFGFSSYSMLLIRAQTNISLNNGSPDNAFSFLGYLSREQYGSEPLLKGPVYNSKVTGVVSKETFRKDADKYTSIEAGSNYTYDKEVLFPRMYSEKHASFYSQYLGISPTANPTFLDNLKFFFGYQVNHMYLRYFMWNFVGRQNDIQGHGGDVNGNWISGIKPIDASRLAGQDLLTDAMKSDVSRQTYFFLPLVLGIIGLLYQLKEQKRDAIIVGLLFFFTGLAIVIYLNQSPIQVRERDYAYAGSFYIFAIWIGLGVLGVAQLLKSIMKQRLAMKIACTLAIIVGPILLVVQNWSNHDRSDRAWTRDLAYNYLESCAPNAILFTYADNDTFPLWYLQEVEGVRTDVRIVNLSYLQSDWYVKQAMDKINDASEIPLHFSKDKIKKGIRDVIYVHDLGIENYTELDTLLAILLSDDTQNQVELSNGEYVNILPTKKLQLSVDKETVIRHDVVPKEWEGSITPAMKWSYNKDYVTKAELSLMAILAHNNWERPIYFANMLSTDNFMGLDKYLVNEGLVFKLMPVEVNQPNDRISLVNKDPLYRNITEKYRWGNISNIQHFDTDYKLFVSNYFWDETIRMALDTLDRSGDLVEASKIANLALKNMPSKIVNMQQVFLNTYVVDTLFKVKEDQQIITLVDTDLTYLDQQFSYFDAVGDRLTGFDIRELQIAVDTLDRYKEILHLHKSETLLSRVDQIEKKYLSKYR